MTGEKCTSLDELVSDRLSYLLVFGFSVGGEKFSLFESTAGVGSKAIDGDLDGIKADGDQFRPL